MAIVSRDFEPEEVADLDLDGFLDSEFAKIVHSATLENAQIVRCSNRFKSSLFLKAFELPNNNILCVISFVAERGQLLGAADAQARG